MSEPLFRSMDSAAMAYDILGAQHSVCYAAPGIQPEPADAMAMLAHRIGPELITVCIDFDERVMRMGFGELAAVKTLRDAGIEVRSTPGLRIGLIIVDDEGYIFTPTALYLEAEQRETAAPNALRLSHDQVAEARARLSPAAKGIAMALTKSPEERERIREQAVEIGSATVTDAQFSGVSEKLEEAPPVRFDVARQVRVFVSYLQYADVSLSGLSIQRHRVKIPRSIQNLGGGDGIQSRLQTTIDLIERDSTLSSKPIEDELNEIKKTFTPSLSKEHGRAMLKAQKPRFEKRLAELRAKIKTFQDELKENLQQQIDASREKVASYYLPRVIDSPPDAYLAQLLTDRPTEDSARRWLNHELGSVFPTAEMLIRKMELEMTYKDVTFETLNKENFLPQILAAFPAVNWEKPFKEFRAAGENAS